jgi:antitoxin CptB
MVETTDIRRKRLLYMASHRGFREADIVIGGFAAHALATMTESEFDEFEALLALNDHDLYAWAVGAKSPPPEIATGPVFRRLLAFDVAATVRPGGC